MSYRSKKWKFVGLTIAVIVVLATCFIVTFQAAYRLGRRDAETDAETEYDPTSLTITVSTIRMNASFYNDTWYGSFGMGRTDDVRAPTALRNDSFMIAIHALWGTGFVRYSSWDRTPHANITVEILAHFWSYDNLTIDRVVVIGQNLTDWKIIDLYDNDTCKMISIDYVNIVFFGYGRADTFTSSGVGIWTARPMAFTVGPIWYEERND